jgi:hypothetical protein
MTDDLADDLPGDDAGEDAARGERIAKWLAGGTRRR